MWTSPNNLSFMGVTGHFVDNNFKINHLLLDFIHVEHRHFGEQLAFHLDKSLADLGIKEKVKIGVTFCYFKI
jgi:hypothetical protein